MTIAKKIDMFIEKSSWIRKMFEEGARLKAQHGADSVFDFSLGNPSISPPQQFDRAVKDALSAFGSAPHGYMPNTGYPDVRKAVAEYLTAEQGIPLSADEVIMTVGAAGALNAIFKALLDPGDEVLTPAPCFVEYGFYADNHGGTLKTVSTREDFSLDLEGIEAAVGPRTKILLINSPNNPTGQIYSPKSLASLGELLRRKSREYSRTLYLVSDEPYRKLVFDEVAVPSIFRSYENSIIATSYSKELSLAGERIGFAAVNPATEHRGALLDALALTNRILGFVNAPALMQRVVAGLQGVTVDVSQYKRKRDLLCDGLAAAGYDFVKAPGTFYLFPRCPISDDVEFVKALQEELILTVPGSGFYGPGHFRISFCVDDRTITDAMPGFKRVMEKYRS